MFNCVNGSAWGEAEARLDPLKAVIAIPANNESDRIIACLSALATQRDEFGAPISAGLFEIVVLVNNSTDDTASKVAEFATRSPQPIIVVEFSLPPERANAGWARKAAMDEAADRLERTGSRNAAILTTDADSLVAPTWFSATMAAFELGVDCVAGYIDAQPAEIMDLGPAFINRGRSEDGYIRCVAEIFARCDPIAHDPWPNHRVSSGASLAVTLSAYRAIGGLPPMPVGEDAALTRTLEEAGFKIRHAMDVCVVTSCRFDGRAKGGAADTMQYRHATLEAPCDDDLEPALMTVKRALIKGRLRRANYDAIGEEMWLRHLRITREEAALLISLHRDSEFSEFWSAVQLASPALHRRVCLHPADLPRETRRAKLILKALHGRASITKKILQDDIFDRERCGVVEAA